MNEQIAIEDQGAGVARQASAAPESTIGVLDELQNELIKYWPRLPDKGLFAALAAGWLAIFLFIGNSTFGYVATPSLFGWMINAYASTGGDHDDGHGFMIPFIVLGLCWWKRKELLSVPLRTWWPAILLVAFALLTHVIGYVVQQPRISIIALFFGLWGLMGLVWGPHWLRVTLPIWALFAFSVPFGSLAAHITFPLQQLVCTLVEWISHFILAIDINRIGTQLIDPTGRYHYEVAAACSGIRSLISIFLLATVYGYVVFRSPWKRLIMMASALPLAVLGNLVRMMLIILASEVAGWFGQSGQVWGNFIHDNGIASMIPYVPAILGVILLGGWLEKKGVAKKEARI